MAETFRLGLPLVQAAQAQKHVTVNEALARLDALVQLSMEARSVNFPPSSPLEGDVYGIGSAPVNEWAGQAGRLAVFINGGWDFVTPGDGWAAWVRDEGQLARWNGVEWLAGALALSPSGAALLNRVVEVDHAVSSGATSSTGPIIPSGAIVLGVTGRVLATLSGTALSFRLGIAGESDDRYGSGIGIAQGAWLRGVTSSPLAYYSDTALTLTAEGGTFAGGVVRLAVHLHQLTLPRE